MIYFSLTGNLITLNIFEFLISFSSEQAATIGTKSSGNSFMVSELRMTHGRRFVKQEIKLNALAQHNGQRGQKQLQHRCKSNAL